MPRLMDSPDHWKSLISAKITSFRVKHIACIRNWNWTFKISNRRIVRDNSELLCHNSRKRAHNQNATKSKHTIARRQGTIQKLTQSRRPCRKIGALLDFEGTERFWSESEKMSGGVCNWEKQSEYQGVPGMPLVTRITSVNRESCGGQNKTSETKRVDAADVRSYLRCYLRCGYRKERKERLPHRNRLALKKKRKKQHSCNSFLWNDSGRCGFSFCVWFNQLSVKISEILPRFCMLPAYEYRLCAPSQGSVRSSN